MRTRRIVILVLAVGDLIARFVLGLPGAFAVLGAVAIIGIPMCLAFMVADAVPWQRDQFIASAVALIGFPMVLLIPTWGWVAAIAVIIAQIIAWWGTNAGAGVPAPA
ncbi:MAG: hypothetical protein WCK40_04785 [Thermoleophilia bacterium]